MNTRQPTNETFNNAKLILELDTSTGAYEVHCFFRIEHNTWASVRFRIQYYVLQVWLNNAITTKPIEKKSNQLATIHPSSYPIIIFCPVISKTFTLQQYLKLVRETLNIVFHLNHRYLYNLTHSLSILCQLVLIKVVVRMNTHSVITIHRKMMCSTKLTLV